MLDRSRRGGRDRAGLTQPRLSRHDGGDVATRWAARIDSHPVCRRSPIARHTVRPATREGQALRARMVVISRYTVSLPSLPGVYSIARTWGGAARRFLSLDTKRSASAAKTAWVPHLAGAGTRTCGQALFARPLLIPGRPKKGHWPRCPARRRWCRPPRPVDAPDTSPARVLGRHRPAHPGGQCRHRYRLWARLTVRTGRLGSGCPNGVSWTRTRATPTARYGFRFWAPLTKHDCRSDVRPRQPRQRRQKMLLRKPDGRDLRLYPTRPGRTAVTPGWQLSRVLVGAATPGSPVVAETAESPGPRRNNCWTVSATTPSTSASGGQLAQGTHRPRAPRGVSPCLSGGVAGKAGRFAWP